MLASTTSAGAENWIWEGQSVEHRKPWYSFWIESISKGGDCNCSN